MQRHPNQLSFTDTQSTKSRKGNAEPQREKEPAQPPTLGCLGSKSPHPTGFCFLPPGKTKLQVPHLKKRLRNISFSGPFPQTQAEKAFSAPSQTGTGLPKGQGEKALVRMWKVQFKPHTPNIHKPPPVQGRKVVASAKHQ